MDQLTMTLPPSRTPPMLNLTPAARAELDRMNAERWRQFKSVGAFLAGSALLGWLLSLWL